VTFNHKHTSCEFVSDLSADLLLPGEEAFCCICINCECQKNKANVAFPPETKITVNGKTFELKDIDKEMTK